MTKSLQTLDVALGPVQIIGSGAPLPCGKLHSCVWELLSHGLNV